MHPFKSLTTNLIRRLTSKQHIMGIVARQLVQEFLVLRTHLWTKQSFNSSNYNTLEGYLTLISISQRSIIICFQQLPLLRQILAHPRSYLVGTCIIKTQWRSVLTLPKILNWRTISNIRKIVLHMGWIVQVLSLLCLVSKNL